MPFLNARDLLALSLATEGEPDIRSRLTDLEFERACLPKGDSLARKMADRINWNYLKRCSAEQWLEEYIFINKRCVQHLSWVTGQPGLFDFDFDSCRMAIASRSEFSYNSIAQVAIHPSLRLAAIVAQERQDWYDATTLDSKLVIRSFGIPYPEWGPDTLLSELSHKATSRGHHSNEIACSWSPCGQFLCAVERSNVYCGSQSQALINVFRLDKEKGSIKPMKNLDLRVSSYAVGNNLWIGPGTLLLPDPLNRGDEPSLLRLSADGSEADLILPSSTGKQKFYNYPAGMLTGLVNGMAAFVVHCRESEDLSWTSDSATVLSEHEHQRIVVLDKNQKRHMEIDVPGVVLSISSEGDSVCFVYRTHATAHFDTVAPDCSTWAPSQPRRTDSFSKNPYAFCGREGEALLYRSYPRYGQPWTAQQEAEDRSSETLLKYPCTLCLLFRESPRSDARRSRINTSYPGPYLPARVRPGAVASDFENDSSEGEPDAEGNPAPRDTSSDSDSSADLFAFQRTKKAKRSAEEINASRKASRAPQASGASTFDSSEGATKHVVYEAPKTLFCYGEADTAERKVTAFFCMQDNCGDRFYGDAPEARHADGCGGPNRILSLSKHSRLTALTVTKSAALVDMSCAVTGCGMNQKTLVVMRHHPTMPVLHDRQLNSATIEPNTLRYARHFRGVGNATSAIWFKSMRPGDDAAFLADTMSYCPTSQLFCTTSISEKCS